MAALEAHWGTQDPAERTSLGIASLEAMAAGKVVLAAANPDTYGPGLLKDGENIIIVKPGNHDQLSQTIIDLLRDKHRRDRIGRNARQTIVDHFSWDRICDQTIQVYHQAMRRRAPS
jgi:glycosyltransferase involved in cell wall biosynthesis